MKIPKYLILCCWAWCFSVYADGGFKDIKFGMTLSQVIAIGGNRHGAPCSHQGYCKIPGADRTIFGKPVSDIEVILNNGVVESVEVRVGFSPREFIGLADEGIGRSINYSYTSRFDMSVGVNLWNIDELHSIKITYAIDGLDGAYERGVLGGSIFNKSTAVKYLNPESSKKERIEAAKHSRVDKKDF